MKRRTPNEEQWPPHSEPRRAEDGAILPLLAIVMVVLFVFAAFAVDLGAAWAERRQDQTAADAAAMAGAIEYVRSNPTEAEVVDIVKDYVERNIGFPASDAGWSACPPPTDGFQALAGTNCVSLRQADTQTNDTLFKVTLPTQIVPTSFARIIGIDTISVTAEAIARIEQNPGLQGTLPFVLPSNPGSEYCLGTPPSGQARGLCAGPSNGLFGTIDSPFFGAAEDPWGTTSCADHPTDLNTRIEWNTAIGIDHFLRIAPDGAAPADGADVCDATQDPSYIPYAILADQGSITQASSGFIGAGPLGTLSQPGRLRQSGGTPVSWRSVPSGSSAISLDNVGLWAYLATPTDGTDSCHPNRFNGKEGTELTAQLMTCLQTGTVKFTDALLDSPRFALVPQIALTQDDIGTLGPNAKKASNIVQFVPVYLQASWFNCSATSCMRFPGPNFDGSTPIEDEPEVFEPGESGVDGCIPKNKGCQKNVNLVLEGVTGLILDTGWMPDSFNNNFNEPGAYDVYLYR